MPETLTKKKPKSVQLPPAEAARKSGRLTPVEDPREAALNALLAKSELIAGLINTLRFAEIGLRGILSMTVEMKRLAREAMGAARPSDLNALASQHNELLRQVGFLARDSGYGQLNMLQGGIVMDIELDMEGREIFELRGCDITGPAAGEIGALLFVSCDNEAWIPCAAEKGGPLSANWLGEARSESLSKAIEAAERFEARIKEQLKKREAELCALRAKRGYAAALIDSLKDDLKGRRN